MIEIRHSADAAAADAYDRIYQDQGIHQRDSFYLFVLDTLRPRRNARLLDVSCGEGQLLHWAARRGLTVHGLDLSRAGVARARAGVPQAQVTVATGEALPYPDATFDYVTCIGSLEHFGDPARGAAEIRRVLRPDGTACILLPNTFGLMWNIVHAWRTGDVSDDGQPIQRYGTRHQWARLLHDAGLRVVAVRKFERPLPRTLPDLWWYLRHRIKLLVSLAVLPWIPTNLAHCFIYLCQRDLTRLDRTDQLGGEDY